MSEMPYYSLMHQYQRIAFAGERGKREGARREEETVGVLPVSFGGKKLRFQKHFISVCGFHRKLYEQSRKSLDCMAFSVDCCFYQIIFISVVGEICKSLGSFAELQSYLKKKILIL